MKNELDRPVTRLLTNWSGGDEAALSELTALLYQELRTLAQRHLRRERSNHTIQRTALVHEAFVRLVDQQSIDWRSRGHFFALASSTMRRILVDHARARLASKRGGGAAVLSLEEIIGTGESNDQAAASPADSIPEPHTPDHESDDELAAIDAALERLAVIDARQVKIVEMRYFGGLTIDETARALDISDATVKREWTVARAWLRRELSRQQT
ncbi:MAG: subfamily polymerase sigma-24 factor [Gammaproteobacteria bacterium]|nr:subfamily polymerase sigma-24 factor [Gammaproteobacteria bacterium]